MRNSKRSVLAAGFGVVALIMTGTGPAFGGEITGNGKFTPNHTFGHAQSICSFSGLEDGDGAASPVRAERRRRTGATARTAVRRDPGRAQGVGLPARRLLQRTQRVRRGWGRGVGPPSRVTVLPRGGVQGGDSRSCSGG